MPDIISSNTVSNPTSNQKLLTFAKIKKENIQALKNNTMIQRQSTNPQLKKFSFELFHLLYGSPHHKVSRIPESFFYKDTYLFLYFDLPQYKVEKNIPKWETTCFKNVPKGCEVSASHIYRNPHLVPYLESNIEQRYRCFALLLSLIASVKIN